MGPRNAVMALQYSRRTPRPTGRALRVTGGNGRSPLHSATALASKGLGAANLLIVASPTL